MNDFSLIDGDNEFRDCVTLTTEEAEFERQFTEWGGDSDGTVGVD